MFYSPAVLSTWPHRPIVPPAITPRPMTNKTVSSAYQRLLMVLSWIPGIAFHGLSYHFLSASIFKNHHNIGCTRPICNPIQNTHYLSLRHNNELFIYDVVFRKLTHQSQRKHDVSWISGINVVQYAVLLRRARFQRQLLYTWVSRFI